MYVCCIFQLNPIDEDYFCFSTLEWSLGFSTRIFSSVSLDILIVALQFYRRRDDVSADMEEMDTEAHLDKGQFLISRIPPLRWFWF